MMTPEPRTFRIQRRYDELMREGKHGHYETLFRVVNEEIRQAVAAERERCARVAENECSLEAPTAAQRETGEAIAAAIRYLMKESDNDRLRKDNPMDAVSGGNDSAPTPAQTLAADLQSTRPGRQEE